MLAQRELGFPQLWFIAILRIGLLMKSTISQGTTRKQWVSPTLIINGVDSAFHQSACKNGSKKLKVYVVKNNHKDRKEFYLIFKLQGKKSILFIILEHFSNLGLSTILIRLINFLYTVLINLILTSVLKHQILKAIYPSSNFEITLLVHIFDQTELHITGFLGFPQQIKSSDF